MAELHVKVTPKARRREIIGFEGECLLVKLTSAPEKGKANKELVRLLGELLGIAQSRIQLLSGATSRHKKVAIEGLSDEQVRMSLKKMP